MDGAFSTRCPQRPVSVCSRLKAVKVAKEEAYGMAGRMSEESKLCHKGNVRSLQLKAAMQLWKSSPMHIRLEDGFTCGSVRAWKKACATPVACSTSVTAKI